MTDLTQQNSAAPTEEQITLYFRFLVSLARMDATLSNAEIASMLRIIQNDYGEVALDFVQKSLEDIVVSPGDARVNADALVGFMDPEDLLIDAVSIFYADGLDQREFRFLEDMCRTLGLNPIRVGDMVRLFAGDFGFAREDARVLTMGSVEFDSDVPLHVVPESVILFERSYGFKVVVIKGINVSVNLAKLKTFGTARLRGEDRLTLGPHGFATPVLRRLIKRKASKATMEYDIVALESALAMVPAGDPRFADHRLGRLVHTANAIEVFDPGGLIHIKVDGHELPLAPRTRLADTHYVSITATGYAGRVFLGSLTHEGRSVTLSGQHGSTHRIVLKTLLPEIRSYGGAVLLIRNQPDRTIARLAGGPPWIFKNDQQVSGTFPLRGGDMLRIAESLLSIERTDDEIVARPVRLRILTADHLTCRFPGSKADAVKDVSFDVEAGEVCAVMGPAGAGKSTLISAVLGLIPRISGKVGINGVEVAQGLMSIRSLVGYVPQDDLFLESLTVRENLLYKLRLCFPDSEESDDQIEGRIDDVLRRVGLTAKRDSQVGGLERRVLSGGERKRLNIALELILDTDMLVLDEPTSGLSSRDAESVIRILREFANRGKIVLMVIHQPSSDIYRRFNRVLVLTQEGRTAYFGDNIKALELFQATGNESHVECPVCHSLNPDLLMRALDTESTRFWQVAGEMQRISGHKPRATMLRGKIPMWPRISPQGRIRQTAHQFTRQLLSKVRDRLNIAVTVVVAPALSLLTAFLLRHSPSGPYSFSSNKQYPIFLFVMVIVALFFGLAGSAAEIIRDRIILKREKLMDVPILTYYSTKFAVLVLFGVVQNALFLLPAHVILEVPHLFVLHVLFMTLLSACGIAFGLLCSSFLPSMSAAYNLVPFILVPQILLGGFLVKYKEMNEAIFAGQAGWHELQNPVPKIGDLMVSRWGIELLTTAEIDLHPYNRIVVRANEKKREVRAQSKGDPSTQAALDAITQKMAAERAVLYAAYNAEIESFENLPPGNYLAKRFYFRGELYETWKRDAAVLALYAILLFWIGYVRVQKMRVW